jgi:hypothetical protein
MIKPFVDAMTVSPGGGHTLFTDSASSNSITSAPVAEQKDTASVKKLPTMITFSDRSVRHFSGLGHLIISNVCQC